MFTVMLFSVLLSGCDTVQEDESQDSDLIVLFSATGWPTAVPADGTSITITPSGALSLSGTVMLSGPEGAVQYYHPLVQADMSGYSIHTEKLLAGSAYRLQCRVVSDTGEEYVFLTNFRTAPAAVVSVPQLQSSWPQDGGSGIAPAEIAIILRFTIPVQRYALRLLLYGAGEYSYLKSRGKGTGHTAVFNLSPALLPLEQYQVVVSGVRSDTGVHGQGGSFSFVTASRAAQLPTAGRVLFSQVCPRFNNSSTGVEFLELYNPYPHPVNLKEEAIRLYRRTGTTWKLVCDFQKKEHFSSGNSPSVLPGYGYFLIANERAAGVSGIHADVFVQDMRISITGTEIFALTKSGPPAEGNTLDEVAFQPADANGMLWQEGKNGLIRRYTPAATAADMQPGGQYRACGNGFDSGTYSNDFVFITGPVPRNSGSEPCLPLP